MAEPTMAQLNKTVEQLDKRLTKIEDRLDFLLERFGFKQAEAASTGTPAREDPQFVAEAGIAGEGDIFRAVVRGPVHAKGRVRVKKGGTTKTLTNKELVEGQLVRAEISLDSLDEGTWEVILDQGGEKRVVAIEDLVVTKIDQAVLDQRDGS
jgi:uncharacterized coiled-coil protein SlyX